MLHRPALVLRTVAILAGLVLVVVPAVAVLVAFAVLTIDWAFGYDIGRGGFWLIAGIAVLTVTGWLLWWRLEQTLEDGYREGDADGERGRIQPH
jgi:hypothetical protein